jgi:hypothetical protein
MGSFSFLIPPAIAAGEAAVGAVAGTVTGIGLYGLWDHLFGDDDSINAVPPSPNPILESTSHPPGYNDHEKHKSDFKQYHSPLI